MVFKYFAGVTVFEALKKREGDKRKRQKNDKPDDIEGYLGPWGKFVDEKNSHEALGGNYIVLILVHINTSSTKIL